MLRQVDEALQLYRREHLPGLDLFSEVPKGGGVGIRFPISHCRTDLLRRTSSILKQFCNGGLLVAYLSVM